MTDLWMCVAQRGRARQAVWQTAHVTRPHRDVAAQLCEGRADRPAMMTLMKDVALPADLAGLVGAGAGAERAVTKVQHFEDDPVLFEYCKVHTGTPA